MKKIIISTLMVFLITSVASAQTFDAKQKTEIEKIVADYLLKNPEKIVESLEAMQKKMAEERKQAAKKALKDNKAQFEGGDLYLGNKNGKTVIVKFFDYNCGFCKSMTPIFEEKIKANDDIKLVLRELPSLSEESFNAAKIAIAASKQGKYQEMHKILMAFKGNVTKDIAIEAAKKLNLDIEKLQKDSESSDVMNILMQNRQLAAMIESRAVPTIIIGDEVTMGALTSEQIDEQIKKLKK